MHPQIYNIYKQRINDFLKTVQDLIYPEAIPLDAVYAKTTEPVAFKDRLNLEYVPAHAGMVWGHEWESAWFHLTAKVPKQFAKKELCLRIHTGGEFCLFSESGCPLYGLTGFSAFDNLYYKERYLLGTLKAGAKIDFWGEAAANGLFGINQPSPLEQNPAKPQGSFEARIRRLDLAVFDREMYGLVCDVKCLFDLLNAFGQDDYRGKQLLHILNKAIDVFSFNPENAVKARDVLKNEAFSHTAATSSLTADCVGHAHIDVGWLWPVRESIRKAGRTFSSQLALMDKYPDYIFGASQAELYNMTKTNYPELFEKIKQRVKDGRWEIQGGWWVEADCNLISGESMVRQFLHGKNFFMDNFGVDVKNLWIPDVFGYSASLPQIIRKAGCDYFLTQKISWSQVNTFPHNTFRWIGVDGSEVLTHFPPEDTYNASAVPRERYIAQNRFREAGYLNEFMSLIGIGDGGGGPSEDYLENNLRMKNLEGCPKAVYKKAGDFFNDLATHRDELPVWNGELYLELHRGTLTTQARTKRGNRKCEQALTALEFLASSLPNAKYPSETLDFCWKKLLLNQFHDIIPGSSIGLVYETTHKEHAAILESCDKEARNVARLLFKKDNSSAAVVNSLSVPWTGTIVLPKGWNGASMNGEQLPVQLLNGQTVAIITVPASSFVTITKANAKPAKAKAAKALVLENALIKYTFNAQGQLVSAIDKELGGKEILQQPGNVLSLYNDHPLKHEAWDVDMFYPRDFAGNPQCISASCTIGTAVSTIDFTYKTAASTIDQSVRLMPNSKRLDFITHVDWHEQRVMLRTAFPVNVFSDNATFDIQYAFVKRPTHDNTSWDEAKFEVCGQRYADLSSDDYGVALLNDCKYGYRVKGNTLDLNLLRSPKYPDFDADQAEHDFTYSLFPHIGNHIAGNVPQEAAVLNRQPAVFDGLNADKAAPLARLIADHASLEIIKKADKDGSHILRIVETAGQHSNAELVLANPKATVSLTNLIEWEKGARLTVTNGSVKLSLKPFEILTLRLG